MDYAFLPPEINSTRMYAGPGSGSLLAAAGSWDSLSADLATTAESYESVLSGLDLQWRGPAAEAMAASAAHYVGWLLATAEQTKQTALQARAAAAAYEQAFAMTVPPPAITANRTLLASLVATNVLGQNTGAIATTEAQYADYWAQDATAMSGYAASSGAATQLPRYFSPNQSTNSSGLAAQNASVTRAVNSALTANPQITANQPVTAAATDPAVVPSDFTILDAIQATNTALNGTYYMEAFTSGIIGAENNLGMLPKAAAAAPTALAPALTAAPQVGGGVGLGNISATLSRAGTIGPMSVPASWAAPSTSHVTAFEPAGMTLLPGTTDEAVAAGYPGYPGMPGGAAARSAGIGVPPRYGVRLTVMPRPPAAG
ncbi:PPE family protein [Mycobacterium sp. SMC-2]|uniref:PPE family protein n=1 Tax=Mycobacterium sp. SMC-2 TaxID=2857058 RepID=UPI0021B3A4B3|nr:PPE family protein [Mycobacterium sp. SMC-2]UXA08443.1 PPE family protein [Mycobacterium sp. SMC-2]